MHSYENTIVTLEKQIEEINKIEDPLSVISISQEEAGSLIKILDSSIDEIYYKRVMEISVTPDVKKDIKIVYSPQHGTGNIPVREVLSRLGYNLIPVLNVTENITNIGLK